MNTLENSCFQFQENDEASKECIRTLKYEYDSEKKVNHNDYCWMSAIDTLQVSSTNMYYLPVISPADYLALLTQTKQLTVADDFPCLNHEQCEVQCSRCKFVQEQLIKSQPEIVPVQEEVKGDKIIIGDNENIKCIADQIEQVFKSHLDDETRIELSAKTAYYYFKNGINQYRKWKEESKSETAHLQQQLKEAKEKLELLKMMYVNKNI